VTGISLAVLSRFIVKTNDLGCHESVVGLVIPTP
jgi:Na+/H+-dicarboxylate symporter